MAPDVMGLVEGLPGWVPVAGAGLAAVVVLALTVWLLVTAKKSVGKWTAGIGPQAVVALGGVAVSIHGLWGFATETAQLPAVLSVAFIGVFDAAEMVLLVMLYRAADEAGRWTPELRLMHRTAWCLVAFSAAMNAIHAPNWWSRPVLAAIPALATWLIELQLRAKLGKQEEDQEEEQGRPGPVRLLVLLWARLWAAVFAVLGLDARMEGSDVARAALARRAARRAYRLRLALPPEGAPEPTRWRARRRLARLERRMQAALDRADVATDPGQGLAFARRMAGLTSVKRVARADYADAPAVLAMLEDLAVTTSADRIAASGEAEAARQRAADARREEQTARQRAADARREAEEAEERAADARQRAEEILAAARQRAVGVSTEEQSARQRAEAARQEQAAAQREAEAARQRADSARQAAQQAEQRAADARREAEAADRRAATARQAAQAGQQTLTQLRGQIAEAERLRDRLAGELADLAPAGQPGAPVWRSEAKQAGWEHYLRCVRGGGEEPTAAELADAHGIDTGNARNWLRDFRQTRAAQLAQQPELVG